MAEIAFLQACTTEPKPDVCHELRVQYITAEWKVKTVQDPLGTRFYVISNNGSYWLQAEHQGSIPAVIDFQYIGLCKTQ